MDEKRRVLVVDDNASMTRTMALILKHKGFDVTVAGDGLAAVAKVENSPFDVVLMDIKMPDMNGVEAFKRIKSLRPQTAVIMMTAYAVEELIEEALAEGACGVLYKPLDIDQTVKLLQHAQTRGRPYDRLPADYRALGSF